MLWKDLCHFPYALLDGFCRTDTKSGPETGSETRASFNSLTWLKGRKRKKPGEQLRSAARPRCGPVHGAEAAAGGGVVALWGGLAGLPDPCPPGGGMGWGAYRAIFSDFWSI